MYDYLAKIILLGPSGCGKSCLLHRFVKNEWRILSSQTIGVEFASKIVKVGTGANRKRIKLQLWDTAGTERFRSVSRSYYRGAAGAILVYDIASAATLEQCGTFLDDARALASPQLTVVLAGNKVDLAEENATAVPGSGTSTPKQYPSSLQSDMSSFPSPITRPSTGNTTRTDDTVAAGTPSSIRSKASHIPNTPVNTSAHLRATTSLYGREVQPLHASQWASSHSLPVSVEVSALNGANVAELFERLARMILTKIEIGEIDPDDPRSGIQYGDYPGDMDWQDGGSVKSSVADGGVRRRKGKKGASGALREWEQVFKGRSRGRGGCC